MTAPISGKMTATVPGKMTAPVLGNMTATVLGNMTATVTMGGSYGIRRNRHATEGERCRKCDEGLMKHVSLLLQLKQMILL